jgi:hypothetical protein
LQDRSRRGKNAAICNKTNARRSKKTLKKTRNHSTHLNFKRRAAAPRKLHVRGALDILDTLPTPPPDSYVSREGGMRIRGVK